MLSTLALLLQCVVTLVGDWASVGQVAPGGRGHSIFSPAAPAAGGELLYCVHASGNLLSTTMHCTSMSPFHSIFPPTDAH